MTRARLRIALAAVAALLAAGCGHADAPRPAAPAPLGSAGQAASAVAAEEAAEDAGDAEADEERASTAAAPPPDIALVRALSRDCQRTITQDDRRGTAAARRLAALSTSARRLERQYRADVARIDALDARIDALRAQIAATADIGAANRLVDEGNALIREHNQLARGTRVLADRSRRQARQADTAIRRAIRAGRSFERSVEACADELPDARFREAVGRLSGRLSTIAGDVGREESASVVCEAPDRWRLLVDDGPDGGFKETGFVRLGTTTIHLSPATCLGLDELLRGIVPAHARPNGSGCAAQALRRDLLGWCSPRAAAALGAIVTLAHEAEHAAGVASEAKATCHALQRAPAWARELGLRAGPARAVGAYVESIVERPPAYRSKECRPGGALDLGLDGTRWPDR